jgi:hypothetical protein
MCLSSLFGPLGEEEMRAAATNKVPVSVILQQGIGMRDQSRRQGVTEYQANKALRGSASPFVTAWAIRLPHATCK